MFPRLIRPFHLAFALPLLASVSGFLSLVLVIEVGRCQTQSGQRFLHFLTTSAQVTATHLYMEGQKNFAFLICICLFHFSSVATQQCNRGGVPTYQNRLSPQRHSHTA
ncbi:hypothetical protein BZA77DRAFT_325751, partial [Pyronema omphalodes]